MSPIDVVSPNTTKNYSNIFVPYFSIFDLIFRVFVSLTCCINGPIIWQIICSKN